MDRFRNVLWALEGTEPESVVSYALDTLESVGASCVLLHAIEPMAGHDPEMARFYKELEQLAMDRMTPILEQLQSRSIETKPLIQVAPRWQAILETARQEDCQMILLGQPQGHPQTPLLGTTSYRILHASPIPVLLMR